MLRIRRSIQKLQDEYTQGNKKSLEDLMRAWKAIKELPPDNPQSFFRLGGYHGEPFRGAGWGNASYWGGYCNHGNILFPTWHRVYVLKLEEALQSIPGCQDVMMPYWDETSEDSVKNGIPWALTQKDFVLDGVTIPNPLRSFIFNHQITDHINHDDPNYSKPIGYETVRYPLSGLVGSKTDKVATEEHNAQYPDYDTNVKLLNKNIVDWLGSSIVVLRKTYPTNVNQKYTDCLDAPNYTVFSNTTSSTQWNDDSGTTPVVALESPHNSIHLAVGGCDITDYDQSPIEGANADMGENDTAALDPIFFFHHCFIDRMFWLWQKKHGFTDRLEVIAEYPGTNSVDEQGATPGVGPNTWLTLASPLDPFKKQELGSERAYTSLDCINIETQLGYTYGPGSLEEQADRAAVPERVSHSQNGKVIRVSGINRAPIRGSFLILAYAKIGEEKYLVGTEAILSRWSVTACANCRTHLEVKAFIPVPSFLAESNATYYYEIRTRDGRLNQSQNQSLGTTQKKQFHVEVR